MKKRYFLSKVILATAATAALVACGGGDDGEPTLAQYEAIKSRMTITQVEAIMGGPASSRPDPITNVNTGVTYVVHIWTGGPYRLSVSFVQGATTGGNKGLSGSDGTNLFENL